jgi:hypothetical protein
MDNNDMNDFAKKLFCKPGKELYKPGDRFESSFFIMSVVTDVEKIRRRYSGSENYYLNLLNKYY